jgi:polar amino acid transport system substrate-binding protein
MRGWLAPVLVIVAVLALIAVVLTAFSAGQPPRHVIVATGEWEPFVGADLPGYGPLARLLTTTMRRAGYEPVYEFGPWSEGLDRAARGEVFGTFPFIRTAEREERFAFSAPLVHSDYVLFYKLPGFRPDGIDLAAITDPAELRQYDVGLVEGYQLWGDLPQLVDIAQTYDDIYAAFEALDRGEIDLLGEGRIVGEDVLQSPRARLDATHFAPIDDEGSWLRGSRQAFRLLTEPTGDKRQVLQQLGRALEELKEAGVYDDILGPLAEQGLRRAPDLVRIGAAVVTARDPRNGRRYLLPRGTRAAVVEWPPAYRDGWTGPASANDRLECRIKVLNGPQRGRVFVVAAEQVEFEERAP